MKSKRIMTLLFVMLGLIAVAMIIGKHSLKMQFKTEVENLFSSSAGFSEKRFAYSQINDLPQPVVRYFKSVLREGQRYISYVRLKHNGQFRTDPKKDWVDIQGEQYFITCKPGFVWKGTTSLFTARDMYINDTGRLAVLLLGVLKIADNKGDKINQGELLRWLGESVWFPTNLLPNDHLQWDSIDNSSAKLTFSYAQISVSYTVSFNEMGEITQLQTQRYMGNGNLETWVGKLSNYREINGIKIPTAIEGIWKLEQGEYSYAKFRINTIEYNKPEKF